MSEYDHNTVEAASKLLVQAIRLRKNIRANSAALAWCEVDEALGRYDLNTLINNLASVSFNDGDNDIPIAKLLR